MLCTFTWSVLEDATLSLRNIPSATSYLCLKDLAIAYSSSAVLMCCNPGQNYISGRLPDAVSTWTRLQMLSLDQNPIEVDFGLFTELQSLTFFFADHCQIRGTLGSDIFSYQPSECCAATLPAGCRNMLLLSCVVCCCSDAVVRMLCAI